MSPVLDCDPSRVAQRSAARPLIVLPPGALAVSTLTARQCRWPIGEVEHAGFGFCEGLKRFDGPYCDRHAERARAGGRR